jgi:stearoyl-CoA desaturase (delta-9 desaturase)
MIAAILLITIAGWLGSLSISIYAHRCLAHRALTLHPAVAHVFRFILWTTTGTRLRRWVAVHRKHHAHTDRQGDPHSPALDGILRILFLLYPRYVRATLDEETVGRYGYGCPDDWLERKVYGERGYLGLALLFLLHLACFGPKVALVTFALQLAWMPWWGGVINGLGHYLGYRNVEVRDQSRNIVPLGIAVAGEELHNNHHAFPRSARFSLRWWEIDVSWWVIRALAAMGLARDIYVGDRPWESWGAPLARSPSEAAPAAREEP